MLLVEAVTPLLCCLAGPAAAALLLRGRSMSE
jgi:hypothetical protein